MSLDERIISKLEGAYDEYVNDNFPHVLIEWKNKTAGAYEAPADDVTEATKPKDQLGYGHDDK